jgi:hypothetical protein
MNQGRINYLFSGGCEIKYVFVDEKLGEQIKC